MPETTMTMAITAMTMPARRNPLCDSVGGMRLSGKLRMLRGLTDVITVHDAEDDRNKNERGDRGEDQSTDHGTTQRRVLLTAIAEAQRHRRHADDHGQRRHQHGAETHETSIDRGGDGI